MLQTDQIRQGIAAPHAGQIARLQRRISELENQSALLEARLAEKSESRVTNHANTGD